MRLYASVNAHHHAHLLISIMLVSMPATVPSDITMQICMPTSMLVYMLFFIFVCMPRVSMPVNMHASMTVVMPTSVPSSILSCRTFHLYSISMPAPQPRLQRLSAPYLGPFGNHFWDVLLRVFGKKIQISIEVACYLAHYHCCCLERSNTRIISGCDEARMDSQGRRDV